MPGPCLTLAGVTLTLAFMTLLLLLLSHFSFPPLGQKCFPTLPSRLSHIYLPNAEVRMTRRRRVSPENMFSLKTRSFIMTPAPPGPHTTQTVLTQSRQGIGIQQVVRLSCNKHLPPFNSLHGTICGSCQCTARIAVFCIMLVWS